MKKEYLLGLLTVLLWSTSATAFKLTLGYMDPVQLLFYATLASTVVVWAILAVQGKTMLIFSLKPREYRIFLVLSFLHRSDGDPRLLFGRGARIDKGEPGRVQIPRSDRYNSGGFMHRHMGALLDLQHPH